MSEKGETATTTTGTPAQAEGTPRFWRGAATLLLVLFALLLVSAALRVGPARGEAATVAAGVAYLEQGEPGLHPEEPPLVPLLSALPLDRDLAGAWPERWRDMIDVDRVLFYGIGEEPLVDQLWLARLPSVVLMILLAFLVMRTVRKHLGDQAAVVAVLLLIGNANLVAYGALALPDGPATGLMFVALMGLVALLERPSAARALLVAPLLGLATLASFSALTLVVFGLLLAVTTAGIRRSTRPLRLVVLAWFGAASIFAAGYGFEARSVNDVLDKPSFIVRCDENGARRVDRDVLGEFARANGVSLATIQLIETRHSLGEALNCLEQELLSPDPYAASAALETLADLEHCETRARRAAFLMVLRWQEPVEAQRRLDVLAALAGREFPDLQSWHRWFETHRYRWNHTLFTQPWVHELTRGIFGDKRPVPMLTAWKGIDMHIARRKVGDVPAVGTEEQPGAEVGADPGSLEHGLAVLWGKHSLPWLVLCLLGWLLATRGTPGWSWTRSAAVLGFPLFFLTWTANGLGSFGIAAFLPAIPFLVLLGSRVTLKWPRLALVLAALSALLGLRFHPHELMVRGLHAATDGSRASTVFEDDRDQGIAALGRFALRYGEDLTAAGGLYYEASVHTDPEAFGLGTCRSVPRGAQGIVAVQAAALLRAQDPDQRGKRKYDWLDEYEPFLALDRSVYLYDTRVPAPGGDPLEEW